MPRVTTLNTTTTTVEPSDNDRSTDRASEWTRLGEIGHGVCVCVCVCVFGAISLTCRLSIGVIGICLPVCNCASFKVSPFSSFAAIYVAPQFFGVCGDRQGEREKVRACQSIERERERLAKWSISIDHLVVMVPLVT